MKTLKSMGLAGVLHYLFWALTAGAALFTLLSLGSFFGFSGSGPSIKGWVTTVTESNTVAMSLPGGNGDFKLYNMGGAPRFVMLTFDDMSAMLQVRYLSFILFQGLSWLSAVFVLFQMARIFQNLHAGQTFRADNTRRIQWIGGAVLAFPALRYAALRILSNIAYEAQGHQIVTAPAPSSMDLLLFCGLIALVVLGLAEVFRYGNQLQQEQDLTI